MATIHRSQRGTIFLAVAAVVAVVVAGAAFLFVPTKTITGQVVDAATGAPLAGALVKTDVGQIQTDERGSFAVPGIRFGSSVSVEAKGHQGSSALVSLGDQLEFALSPSLLQGVATDSSTRKPVPGVRITAGTLSAESDGEGQFKLVGLDAGAEVVVAAEGYQRLSMKFDGETIRDLALNPNALSIKAVNQFDGKPLVGAEATDGQVSAKTDQQGQAHLQYVRDGAEVTVKLEGYWPAKVNFTGQDSADLKLRPSVVTGVVKDAKGQPVAAAEVSDGNASTKTDAQGFFKLSDVPENAKLAIMANGYERKQVEVGQQANLEVALKPFSAKGLYLTYYGVGDDGLRNHVLELADKTEVNAVVIDIKGDRGWLAYKSNVPMVQEIGAQQEIMIPDARQFLADLRKRGVYSIARIVVFKDNPLVTARPDLAAMSADTGQPWVDNEGLRWADPTRQEVWDYNIALAVEAIDNGFDEVQFDYVRFPTDAGAGNSLDSIRFSEPNLMANRIAAINGFLEMAKQAIHAKGGAVSADIFGYVVWRDDDMGIGQRLEDVAAHVDYVSPMVYPNLFWDGIELEGEVKYANQTAGLYPYEIVSETMKIAVRRIGAAKLRPWLEYYNDYLTGKDYTADDMIVQKKASYENGVTGWLFWDPSNRFVKGGFEPNG